VVRRQKKAASRTFSS